MPKRDVPQAGGPRAGGRALKRGQLFGGADTLQNLQEGEGLALNERKEEGTHCRQRGDPQRFGKCPPHNVWWRLPSSWGLQECCLLLPSCSVCAGQTRERDRCKILHLASKLMLLWDKPWGSLSPSPVPDWECLTHAAPHPYWLLSWFPPQRGGSQISCLIGLISPSGRCCC